MSKPIRIYDDDSEVYGRGTKIRADKTKADLDGVLARFGIKDVWWRNDIPHNDVFVKFVLSERFGEKEREIMVSLEPPRIYHKKKNSRGYIVSEEINWDASMRNLYWYILTHLSQAYVNQSSKFQEFLPNILANDGRRLKELMKDKYQSLPEIVQKKDGVVEFER